MKARNAVPLLMASAALAAPQAAKAFDGPATVENCEVDAIYSYDGGASAQLEPDFNSVDQTVSARDIDPRCVNVVSRTVLAQLLVGSTPDTSVMTADTPLGTFNSGDTAFRVTFNQPLNNPIQNGQYIAQQLVIQSAPKGSTDPNDYQQLVYTGNAVQVNVPNQTPENPPIQQQPNPQAPSPETQPMPQPGTQEPIAEQPNPQAPAEQTPATPAPTGDTPLPTPAPGQKPIPGETTNPIIAGCETAAIKSVNSRSGGFEFVKGHHNRRVKVTGLITAMPASCKGFVTREVYTQLYEGKKGHLKPFTAKRILDIDQDAGNKYAVQTTKRPLERGKRYVQQRLIVRAVPADTSKIVSKTVKQHQFGY